MSGRTPETPEEVRAALLEWADQLAVNARRNLRLLMAELREAAHGRGEDLTEPGGLERARQARAADADVGKRQRDAGAVGGRMKRGKYRVAPEATGARLRAEVGELVDAGMSLTKARKEVAMAHGMGLSTLRDRTK